MCLGYLARAVILRDKPANHSPPAPGPAISVGSVINYDFPLGREDGNRKERGLYSAGNHIQCPVINLMEKNIMEGHFSDCIRDSWKTMVPVFLWSVWACIL